jgi:hypothetical protein
VKYCSNIFASVSFSDVTAGVSENCMLGHLVPQGTGSFDLLLDHHMLADAHQAVEHLPPPVLDHHTQPNDTGPVGMMYQRSPSHDISSFDDPNFSPYRQSPGVSPGKCRAKPFLSLFCIICYYLHRSKIDVNPLFQAFPQLGSQIRILL